MGYLGFSCPFDKHSFLIWHHDIFEEMLVVEWWVGLQSGEGINHAGSSGGKCSGTYEHDRPNRAPKTGM